MEEIKLGPDLMPNISQAYKVLDTIIAQQKLTREEAIVVNNSLKVLYDGAKHNEASEQIGKEPTNEN